ncbi:MAG: hypothetical protein QNJ53_08980 [Pleurocapsa sp. MO_192.B19]|nr:hypothetical protein [Pleurocapsa sp. MO_192.B19]
MNSINKTLTIKLAVASTVALSTLVPAQPASAQLLELATGALSIFNSITGKSNPQPAPQQAPPVVIPQQSIPRPSPNLNAGTGNLNGNTINLCISNCLPSGTQAIPPRPNTINTFPPSTIAQPRIPVAPQPAPNRPVLSNPPTSLPPN